MREIKFRAWDGSRMTFSWIMISNGQVFSPTVMPIMQFTSLKDKNGKEIYEGDLVKHSLLGLVGEVIFESGSFTLRFSKLHYIEKQTKNFTDDFRNGEVIGNIYENPELL